jgi:hypothetical protein
MTGTELLMAVADRFRELGESEDVIVIYTTEDGKACLKSNCNHTRSLGLAAFAVADIEDSLVRSESGGFDEEGRPIG